MVRVKIFNNSNADIRSLDSLSTELSSRLSTIDFSKFGIFDYSLHIVINADKQSVELATPLPKPGRYIYYQGIPSEFAYNSEFEAKLSTIRLRIQNAEISFANYIENIIFIVDFKAIESTKSQENSNHSIHSTNTTPPSLNPIIRKSSEDDKEAKRKASFVPIRPLHRLESVVMTPDMAVQIEDALSIIRNRKKIYEDWGFSEVDPQPKAILSFWGPPGTGKTKCAHGVASAMKQQILCVNYAEIESMYAGESPKNLIAAFNAAQENNAVLFFDEADSFLGKRITNVQSGHDQSINSLRSQMLIQLESFEGIVIFATNLVKNFDPAFQTRILRHIKFDMPDEQGRIAIFKELMPKKTPFSAPLSADDYQRLSEISEGFSGRDIRNSILDALSAAAKDNVESLSIDYFFDAISKRQEAYKKLKDDKKRENDKLAEDIKNSIIERSKKEFNEALIGIALYAAWADNILAPSEEILLNELCEALKVDMPAGLSNEYLPPLSQILEYFNTPGKKLKAIDLAIRIVAIDGQFVQEERNFISDICNHFRFPEEKILKLMAYAESLASLNQQWANIGVNV